MLKAGIKNEETMVVEQKNTAKAMVSGALEVFATPAMIAMMEYTAYNSVLPFLEKGEDTVGTLVNVKHLSATPVGMKVRFESELVEADRKRLVFRVAAYDEAGLIGEGTHERFIISCDKFIEKTYSKTGRA